ncbi:MAG: hypothetical protein NTW03_08545, partial [Verrucomicrobia bacterium]|nr:hypothetical protein [Verrucomicrobiota bacterium]
DELARQGVGDPATFNYREVLRDWLAQKQGRKGPQHPLWSHWRIYQLRGAAQFMEELRAAAARTAGHPVPMGANAGLLWGPHLCDYKSVDLFSAEIPHRLASTASGGDWAFIKEQKLPGLVQGWIALSYAAGHGLMVPDRQWCYTPQKGTHWYAGPKEKFAPLYQFVSQNAVRVDDYQNHADLTVAFSQKTFDRDAGRVIALCNKLAAANISYRLALGGNEVVDHPLPMEVVSRAPLLLVLEPKDFAPADQKLLATVKNEQRCESVEQALTKVVPAVRVESKSALRVLPRVKPGSAVIHLVNWTYDAGRDAVQPIKNARLTLNLQALGVANAKKAMLFAPRTQPLSLPIEQGGVTVPELGLWKNHGCHG